ncbi:glycosyl hydrolases family 31-domain-containing protein [Neocallimastix lanati (nom. inval.)]|nr:glycosyl hydrolases family 31-domain-containing protein [Neocallimastix sp. JGI-2020a]
MKLGKYYITISNVIYFAFILTALFITPGMCVKSEDFKKCNQSGFCVRQRAYSDLVDKTNTNNASPYKIIQDTIEFNKKEGVISAKVLKTASNTLPDTTPMEYYFNLKLYLLKGGAVRMNLEEADDTIKVRFDASKYALENNTPESAKKIDDVKSNDSNVVSYTFGEDNDMLTIVITLSPMKIEIYKDGEVSLVFNQNGYLNYEEHRIKEETSTNEENASAETEAPTEVTADAANEISEEEKQRQEEIKNLIENTQKDMWSETFKGNTDTKPFGPESIGFDISFPGFKDVYGIPQHTSPLDLKTTRNGDEYTEPYRLYNLDVFEYIIDSPMAIYGAIPFMLAHKSNRSAGILFVNSSEMWIDVEKNENGTITHWMAEAGKFDVFFFVNKTPKDVIKTYMNIAGKPQLPQYFAIAYHQCRWNYNDEADVLMVDNKFDEYGIPYDVIWLDIEHTDGKRYFTWDLSKFPDPKGLQEKISLKGRKMVTIIDPHIKVDNNYYVYKEAKDKDLYVHNNQDKPFDGWCWPGSSSWVDYLNPEANKWLISQYDFDKYEGSTENLYTWIDMNEPSVFSGPETTMPKDNLHFGKVEHRDVHNIYGALYHKATFDGHIHRSKRGNRPFILSRSFFIGSQRYGAIWTGDNDAKWDHLRASIPMTLSIGLSGLPFAGADIGGFFNNPEKELYIRWYQTAAFQPFVRGHSHIETKRREPWLYDDETISLVRDALYERYNLLPYWYTLFKEASVTGIPMTRPMFMNFPEDEKSFNIQDQFMVGDDLLVKPVITEGQTEITVYLPKVYKWYNYKTFEVVETNEEGNVTIPTQLSTIPVFQRGGSIIPQRLRHRRSSTSMKHDPYTLLIALDEKNEASGLFYVDDGSSIDYTRGFYIYRKLTFANNILTSSKYRSETDVPETHDEDELMILSERIERIRLVGVDGKAIQSIQLIFKGVITRLEFTIESEDGHVIAIKYPGIEIKETNWKIEILY